MAAREGGTKRARKGQTRWFSVLLGVAIVMVTGTVLADVVLTYVVNNNVKTTGNSPFVFKDGANAPTAYQYGLMDSFYYGGPQSVSGANGYGSSVSTGIAGLNRVNVEMLDVTEFAQNLSLSTYTATIGAVSVFGTAAPPAGLVCAYAFVTTYLPATSGAPLAQPANSGCLAFAPYATGTTGGQGCGTNLFGDTINLTSSTFGPDFVATTNTLSFGSSVDDIGGLCSYVGPGTTQPTAGSVSFWISYAIFETEGVTGGATVTLASFTVPVVIS